MKTNVASWDIGFATTIHNAFIPSFSVTVITIAMTNQMKIPTCALHLIVQGVFPIPFPALTNTPGLQSVHLLVTMLLNVSMESMRQIVMMTHLYTSNLSLSF